jgi:hypothetical protein
MIKQKVLLCLILIAWTSSQSYAKDIISMDMGNCWAQWGEQTRPLQLRLTHFQSQQVIDRDIFLDEEGEETFLWCSLSQAFITQRVRRDEINFCWRWDLLRKSAPVLYEDDTSVGACLGHRRGELVLWAKKETLLWLEKQLPRPYQLKRVGAEEALILWDNTDLHTQTAKEEISALLEKERFAFILEYQKIFYPVGETRRLFDARVQKGFSP